MSESSIEISSPESADSNFRESDDKTNSLLDGFQEDDEAFSHSPIHSPSVSLSDEGYNDQYRERFQGSKYLFLSRNRNEKDLATSLDSLDAEDLSVHLYNVHAWKRRVRQQCESQRLEHISVHDESSKAEWQPGPRWTAWPLPPNRIPRPHERFMHHREILDGEGAIKPKLKTREKPSQPLQECLLSEVLKQSRKRYYEETKNDYTEEGDSQEQFIRKWRKHDHLAKDKSERHTQDILGSKDTKEQAQDNEMNQNRNNKGSNETESNDFDSDYAENMARRYHELKTTLQLPRPVVALDEEECRKKIQPAIHHILAKLDRLLTALHTSALYSVRQRKSASVDADSSAAISDAFASKYSVNKAKFIKTTPSTLPVPGNNYRPRDWSELLAIAALAGWDPEVIKKVASRCSLLLGESMSFRTLPERESETEYVDSIVSDHDNIPSTELSDNESDGLISSENDKVALPKTRRNRSLKCPIQSCEQVQQTWTSPLALKEHLMDVHDITFSHASSSLPAYLNYLTCPFHKCEAYNHNFFRLIFLKQHLATVHKFNPNDPNSEKSKKAAYEARLRSEANEETYGAVHIDGFLKPIRVPTNWTDFRHQDDLIGRKRSGDKDRRSKIQNIDDSQ